MRHGGYRLRTSLTMMINEANGMLFRLRGRITFLLKNASLWLRRAIGGGWVTGCGGWGTILGYETHNQW